MARDKKKAEKKSKGVDPSWPVAAAGDHPVSEFNADRQGALSPFGEVEFPLPGDQVPYVHPVTVINR
jgi:hypothetical protein